MLGRQGGEIINAREMASTIGTVPYEVLVRIGPRIERTYDE
jgi:alanine racemase